MEYDIDVVPAPVPVTVPSVPTVAIVTSLLVQPPPAVASVSDVVKVLHMVVVPDTGAGCVFTVTVVVYMVAGLHPLPVLLTVKEYTPLTEGVITGFCKLDE